MAIKINLGKTIILRNEDDGTGVISYNGGIYSVNEITVLILNGLYNQKSLNEIIQNIMDEYNVKFIELKEDIKTFFLNFYSINIISKEYLENILKELELCVN